MTIGNHMSEVFWSHFKPLSGLIPNQNGVTEHVLDPRSAPPKKMMVTVRNIME